MNYLAIPNISYLFLELPNGSFSNITISFEMIPYFKLLEFLHEV